MLELLRALNAQGDLETALNKRNKGAQFAQGFAIYIGV